MKARARKFYLSVLVSALIACTTVSASECKEVSASSDPSEIRAYVERINRLPSPTGEQLIDQANALGWLKDYKSALRSIDRAIKLNPKDGQIYSFRGLLNKRAKNFPAALRDFDKAVSLGSTEPGLYGERMTVKLQLQDFLGAEQDADKFLKLKPDSSTAFYIKGRAAEARGRTSEAVEYFTKSMSLSPSNPAYVYARGLVFEKLGRETEAAKDFAKAKELGYR